MQKQFVISDLVEFKLNLQPLTRIHMMQLSDLYVWETRLNKELQFIQGRLRGVKNDQMSKATRIKFNDRANLILGVTRIVTSVIISKTTGSLIGSTKVKSKQQEPKVIKEIHVKSTSTKSVYGKAANSMEQDYPIDSFVAGMRICL